MKSGLPDRFYLTGTDTDVGKTVTAALLCAAFGLDYWKPVQAGDEGETDRQLVERLSGATTHPERFCLKRAASPHAASEDEGIRISCHDFILPDTKRLVVEGAGGFMVPYATDPLLWQSALMKHLGLPTVVVARSGLGTLNHTFLTLRALESAGLACAGLILIGPHHRENARDLQAYGRVPLLFEIPWLGDLEEVFLSQVAKLSSWGGS